MSQPTELIPRPSAVREQLAKNLKQARLLRRLLRLAYAASEERIGQADQPTLVNTSTSKEGRS